MSKKKQKQTFLGQAFEDEPFGTGNFERPTVRMDDGRVVSWEEAEAELFPQNVPDEDDISDLGDIEKLITPPRGNYVSIPEEAQVQFNNTYDVQSLAVASLKHPGLVYVDCSMPRYDETVKCLNGETADLWKYLSVHELVEARAMAEGVPYLTAHVKFATPAEREAVERDCGEKGWKKYTEAIDGFLNYIEHKPIKRPPPDPHVPPAFAVGHHRSVHKH